MDSNPDKTGGSAGEVFLAFLQLGLTSFGGPIAHLGYFREAFVNRRRWIDEHGYAELVALCQFLPGPASSQVGFAIGLKRAGYAGALAAWAGFTLPSAILLVLFAYGLGALDSTWAQGALHGLKIVAVAVVAQAVWGMARTLAPDRMRASIAVVVAILAVLLAGSLGQVLAIGLGGVAGLWLCRDESNALPETMAYPVSRRVGAAALLAFAVLLLGLPLLAGISGNQGIAVFDAFYRSGALVFGGGHVVLPLLEAETVATGWIGQDAFLAGYGAAQAVPGPLFTFAAFLGAVATLPPNGVAGALLALVAVFLPGLLLVLGALPFWNELRARTWAQSAMWGTNAAVVGVLGAALYDPVWTSAILGPIDFAMALAGFVLLVKCATPPWLVVVLLAATGAALGQFGMGF